MTHNAAVRLQPPAAPRRRTCSRSASNVAGNAGLLGVATDPFDWGAPNLSFSRFTSLRDINPSMRTDQTISVGDTMMKIRGKQTLRFGGDYPQHPRRQPHRRQRARQLRLHRSLHRHRLRRLPARPAAAGDACSSAPAPSSFRSTSWDLFVQDDWRATDKLTVNAGLRYEYFSPLSEADNRLVTLDAAPGFTAAVPVVAGGTGPYSGALPDTIVQPFRDGFAPRVGVAWRPKPAPSCAAATASTTTRASISTSRSSSPPSRRSRPPTRCSASPRRCCRSRRRCTTCSPARPRTPTASIPNYRLGYVQIWNLDRAARSDAHRAARHRLHRHEGIEPRHPARAEPRARRPADCRRAAVHLGIVRRRLDHERADAAAAPAADRAASAIGRHLHAVAARSTTPRRSAAAAARSRRTIRISPPSAGSRASISATASPATSPTSCRSARTSAGSTAAWPRRCSATGS